MLPFLFLGTRAEDAVADAEYAAVLRFSGLEEGDLRRVRLEERPLGPVDLADWAGIVLGGSPFNISDPADAKSATQRRVEAELHELAVRVVAEDFPFLGACYGIGTLGTLQGGLVDRSYGEPIGPVTVQLTEAGLVDPLFDALPRAFEAFVGHKEAVTRMPLGAVLLAASATCPVQGFRLGENVYATQFHPELDVPALLERISVYRHHGYFDPEELDVVLERARSGVVTEPPLLLRRFVELYAR
jgi:GMP synthase (glutamine-hydrolysing)